MGFTLYHNRAHVARAVYEGIAYALNSCANVMRECGLPVQDLMLIGGGDVYAQLMHLCDTAYVTEILARSLADTFFHLDGEWKCIARESARNREPDFDFCVYRRVKSSFSGTELHKPHGL